MSAYIRCAGSGFIPQFNTTSSERMNAVCKLWPCIPAAVMFGGSVCGCFVMIYDGQTFPSADLTTYCRFLSSTQDPIQPVRERAGGASTSETQSRIKVRTVPYVLYLIYCRSCTIRYIPYLFGRMCDFICVPTTLKTSLSTTCHTVRLVVSLGRLQWWGGVGWGEGGDSIHHRWLYV